jgi:hypothetical protein
MGAAVLRCEQLAVDIENRDGGVATFDLQSFAFRHIASVTNSGKFHIVSWNWFKNSIRLG